jgi:phospholipase/lecithinase/hemolysin
MHSNLRARRNWLRHLALTAVAGAALLAGCGGGGDAIPLPKITSVKVLGDSLADVGTFGGVRATVQGTTAAPELMFPEIVARSYGLTQHCNFYAFTGTTFAVNTAQTGCTNFAIGGGRINGATAGMATVDPRNIVVQMQTAATAAAFTANDLVLIDGGGNDAADIVGLYLAIGQAAAVSPAAQLAAITNYGNALKTVLPAATVDTRLGTAQGLADLGGLYMTALAGRFHDQIKANVLDRGAKQVMVINMPAITNTPRFQAVLNGIAAANGGGTTGAAARAAADTLFKNWVVAFNTELSTKFTGNTSVVVLDLYTRFNDQIANPTTYGLTNVKDTACPVTGTGSDGLPAYNFATCTAAALTAQTPPAGATGGAGWWRTYLFSDGFHPTPYGHSLAAAQIRSALFNNSWQ